MAMGQNVPGTFVKLRRISTVAILVLQWQVGARGEDLSPSLGLSGSLRADYFQSSRTLDDAHDLIGGTVQLKGTARPVDNVKFGFEARSVGANVGHPSNADSSLVEGYIAVRQGPWDWRFGKQIIAWGRADGINPTDVISPRDYTVPLPFDEDQRLGAWALATNYAWSPEISLSVIWKAGFSPSSVPMSSDAGNAYTLIKPDDHAPELGVRLNRSGSDVDWSVSLYRGRSLLPHAGFQQPTSGTPLQLTYPSITMVGADMTTNVSTFGTRLEFAYTYPTNSNQTDQPGMQRNLYVVAGIDRTFFPRLNVNVQLFLRRAWDLSTGNLAPQYAAADQFNEAMFMQQRSQVTGMTMRIANYWLNDTLAAEVFVQRYFLNGDTFVQTMMTYAFTDSVRGTIGGRHYAGQGPQFGPLRKTNGAFAEIRYSF
ncbi:MAG: hypothetical protein PHS32_03610 [Rhodoferax sp.]|uniref:DUF1302 family protein n=1 Tax=Rhodoferax sp. TaxID=50421 RepID=UPI00262B3E14|nr:DUF1302 family protein [Rhodoferax sp.]MDD5332810.1 hypothetical protein [Rhodoferax sp.]